jgi:enoyl-CoA hydratase/carnithine racemase
MPYRTLSLTTEAPTAELRLLDRAADDAGWLAELEHAAAAIADDASIRSLLIALADTPELYPPLGGAAAPALRFFELMPQPVIGVIEGDAYGAVFELLLACDMRVCADDATFVLAGVMPSLGATQRLPRLIGRARASEMILLGAPLDAAGALACGLVNAVTPVGGAFARAQEIAASIAARGPIAVRYAKEAIVRGLDMPLDQALRYETDLTVILQTTDDRAEGVRAFLEKRAPKFEGR